MQTLVEELPTQQVKPAAILRLRRGASPRAAWTFGDHDALQVIRVGSDPICDWQIEGEGVMPVELTVFFTGKAVYVKSERPFRGARLNGERLEKPWMPLPHGSRLEMGTAIIQVVIRSANDSGAVSAKSEPPLPFDGNPRPRMDSIAFAPTLIGPVLWAAGEREAHINARVAAHELGDDDVTPVFAMRPSLIPPMARREPQHLHDSTVSTLGLLPGLSLTRTPAWRPVRYAQLALAVVLAYGLWVLLLNQV